MRRKIRAVLIAAVVFLGGSASAGAMAIYAYTGNPFSSASAPYTTAMRVTGFFTVAVPLAPNLSNESLAVLDWALNDGVNTLDPSNTPASEPRLQVDTDAAGAITGWRFAAQTALPMALGEEFFFISALSGFAPTDGDLGTIFSCTGLSPAGVCNASSTVAEGFTATVGSWSLVPEPGTAMLLFLGLGVLGGVRRSKR